MPCYDRKKNKKICSGSSAEKVKYCALSISKYRPICSVNMWNNVKEILQNGS